MKKRFFLFYLIFSLITNTFIAQNKKLDSLLIHIKTSESDTNKANNLRQIGLIYSNRSSFDTAIQYYNKSLLLSQKLNFKKGMRKCYNNIGNIYSDQSDYPKALTYHLKALKIAEESGDKKDIGRSYNNIGLVYYYKSDFPKTLEYYFKSLKIYEETEDKDGAGMCYLNIGIVYNDQSNYPKALDHYFKALKIYEETEDKDGVGMCNLNIGLVYCNQANYPRALEFYLKALKIKEKKGDKKGITICYTNIGNIYYNQSNYSKALDYYSKALVIKNKIGDIRGTGYCYLSIGSIYNNQSNYPKALEYYFKALKIYENIGNDDGIADCYINIGNAYGYQSNAPKALEYYFKAIKMCEENGNEGGKATCFANIADLYNVLSKYSLAITYADSAISISKKTGEIDTERLAYQYLAEAYSKSGKYQQAYENHVKFKALTDSIFNVDNSKQLGDLKTNFEVEKKEVELKAKADAQELINTEEKKRQQLIIYTVAGTLLIVIVFSALLYKRFRLTNQQKKIITIQKQLVEEKHREITDSINYAERIQRSFLATEKQLGDNLSNYFVLFKPKDIVSGDFYWSAKLSNNNFALVTADSTGHGVPGAIMSLLNVTSLEKAIEHHSDPAEILNHTRKTIIERLKKDGSKEGGKDGMDCSLLVFDFANKQLHIAAANNPVWIIRNNEKGVAELVEVKPDKMPVGKSDKQDQSFTLHTIHLQKGDTIYTLTDGFPDQFGGPNGKKFMNKKLKQILLANVHLPIPQQKELLETTFNNWIGNLEQVDDVCVVGVRI